jgi:hypothetical protein
VEAYLTKNKQLVVNLHKNLIKEKKDASSRILFGIKLNGLLLVVGLDLFGVHPTMKHGLGVLHRPVA